MQVQPFDEQLVHETDQASGVDPQWYHWLAQLEPEIHAVEEDGHLVALQEHLSAQAMSRTQDR